MRPLVLLFLVGALSTVACSGTHEPRHDRAIGPAPKPFRDASGLDVPQMLSLSIDELTEKLGPRLPLPEGFFDPVLAPLVQRKQELDSTVLFKRRGLAIVVSYDHSTRRVSNFLLLGENENELMRRAQLRLSAEQYLVLPVFKERPATELMGLRVLAVALNQ